MIASLIMYSNVMGLTDDEQSVFTDQRSGILKGLIAVDGWVSC